LVIAEARLNGVTRSLALTLLECPKRTARHAPFSAAAKSVRAGDNAGSAPVSDGAGGAPQECRDSWAVQIDLDVRQGRIHWL
jgi:hypothetical protein